MKMALAGNGSVSLLALLIALPTAPLQAQDSADESSDGLIFEEIVVYSRSRKESGLSIPQTVDVLDNKLLTDVNALTVGDALRFIPGASQDGSKLDAFSDDFLIRGFGSSQTINGTTKNQLNHSRDAVNIERIEVLKGPASVLYGQLDPGAVINVVTKQPEEEFSAEAGFEMGRYDHYRGTLDVTGSITDSGNARFRLTAAYENSDSFVDFWNREHIFIAPSVAIDLGEDTTFTVEALYSKNDWSAFYNGVPVSGTLFSNTNGEIPINRHTADPTLDGTVRRTTDITARLEHSFSDNLALRAVFSWTDSMQDFEEVFGISSLLLGIPEEPAGEERLLYRATFNSELERTTYTAHLDLSTSFDTGSITHEVAFGADFEDTHRVADSHNDVLTPLDLFSPTYSLDSRPTVIFPNASTSFNDTSVKQYGIFLQDRVYVSDQLKFIGGLRYSRVEQDVLTVQGGTPRPQDIDTSWTSQIGVLYTPFEDENIAFFASRTTSFQAVLGTTFGGPPLEPESGTQYEVGVKGRFMDDKLAITLAGYHIKRANVAVADRDNPGFNISIGEQAAKGIELSVRMRPTPHWDIYAAYAYTDHEITEDTDATRIGAAFRNVPKNTFAINTTYDFSEQILEGLRVGANANYVDDRPGDLTNSFTNPSYWRVDTFASYALTEDIDLKVNIENLLNERYYSHSFSIREIWPSAPRTWRASITTRF